MKRALTIVLALGIGASAFADDAEKKPAATETQAAPAEPVTTADSPMVAAAKRANRKGRKPAAPVITNDTLNKSGAGVHVSTTAQQKPFVLPKEPPVPTMDMMARQIREAEQRRVAAQAAAEKKAATEKQQSIEAAAAAAEEGLYHDEEYAAQEAQKKQEENKKPPQR